MKTPREILEELCKEYKKHNGVGCSHQFDHALSALRECVLGKKKTLEYSTQDQIYNKGYNNALQDIANLFRGEK